VTKSGLFIGRSTPTLLLTYYLWIRGDYCILINIAKGTTKIYLPFIELTTTVHSKQIVGRMKWSLCDKWRRFITLGAP
jgi:hypothetical protein